MKNRLYTGFLAVTLVLVLCFGVLQLTPVAYAKVFPVTLTDDAGRAIVVQAEPGKIVSLAPSSTEILFTLGLGNKIVGVTSFDDYPSEVKRLIGEGKITVIGGYTTPNVERIIELKPDLVLGHTLMGQENLRRLEDAGIRVLILQPTDIAGIYSNILMVGKATGYDDTAALLVNTMKERISTVEKAVSSIGMQEKVRVAYVVWLDPIWVAGRDTFVHSAIQTAGGINVFSDLNGWQSVGSEALIARNPHVIIYSSMALETSEEVIRTRINAMFESTDAVRNGRVYMLLGDASSMLDRPGPGMVDGIEALAKFFHPRIYGEPLSKTITERKVSIRMPLPSPTKDLSPEQLRARENAKRMVAQIDAVGTVDQDAVNAAMRVLIDKGLVTAPDFAFEATVAEAEFSMLQDQFGSNLERYPSAEGRVWWLYMLRASYTLPNNSWTYRT